MGAWTIYLNLLLPFIIKIFIPDGRYGALTIITDIVILPLLLIMLNGVILIVKIEESFVKCCIFMMLGLVLGDLVGYVVWGISSGNLLKPDEETLHIIKSLILYHLGVVAILFLLIQVGRFIFMFFKKR